MLMPETASRMLVIQPMVMRRNGEQGISEGRQDQESWLQ